MTNCQRLKFPAKDGKIREIDCADTKGIFRIIQSIPSLKAEPFKRWLVREYESEIRNFCLDFGLRGE